MSDDFWSKARNVEEKPEILKELNGGVVADFHVKLQADAEPPSPGAGRSLTQEVTKLQHEVQLLREQLASLCAAVRGLVQLNAVLNQGVQMLVKRDGGGSGADFAVL
jgi:hypothetical protein